MKQSIRPFVNFERHFLFKNIMEISKKLVTPEDAKNWLENCNLNNRAVSFHRVSAYVSEIEKGNWREDTGECIKFSKTGRLLDGQHRLHAILKSGVSIYLHIASNLEDSVFKVIDTGKPRGGQDAMRIAGIGGYAQLSSIIQKYYILKNGAYKSSKGNSLSNSELLNTYNLRPFYWDAKVNYALRQKVKFSNVISNTLIGAFSATFDHKDVTISELFFEELCTGKDITNSSIDVLRNRLIKEKVSKVNVLSKKVETAFIIKTWNAYRLNKDFKIIKFDESLENFPTII